MSDDVTTSATIASLRELAERLTDYNRRLIAENVRLSNEAATARERAGVLEAEVRASRQPVGIDRVAWDHALQSARDETDRRNALDAAKFGGAT